MNQEYYQRWLAVGLLAAVLALALVLVIIPLISYGLTYYDEKNDLMFRLQRQQKIVARKDTVAQNLETVKKQFVEQGFFSNRDTEALASADLQNIVKTAVTEAGGQLTSTQGLPGKTDNGFNRVSVRVRMSCTIDALRTVLAAFATTTPVLIVDQLDIAPVRGNRNNNRGANKIDPSAQLNVSFQVVSFMRAGQP